MTETLDLLGTDPSQLEGLAASIRSLEGDLTFQIGRLYRRHETDQADRLSMWLDEALDGAEMLERIAKLLRGPA